MNEEQHADSAEKHHEEPPPFGSWPRMYTFVLSCLGLEIILFYIFTRVFE